MADDGPVENWTVRDRISLVTKVLTAIGAVQYLENIIGQLQFYQRATLVVIAVLVLGELLQRTRRVIGADG
ncbi:hypothetical protein [Natrinema versiforme]|uniref:Uncharacterized protein n=1 Tax=Natrinema versiforme JCM 10478 TaxID=1227496 RepID=L9YAW7_9EURY|nr:hypothetical protein [Natrinema versiforme]ELY70867.1 hypothetical protein C489_00876 [Natrinema versiforme JCM 10478]